MYTPNGDFTMISPSIIFKKTLIFKHTHTLNFTPLASMYCFKQIRGFPQIIVGEIIVKSPY